MTFSKRAFDVVVGIMVLLFCIPIMFIIYAAILLLDGRPIFYVSERVYSPGKNFYLIKFRTMKPASKNTGVSGGDKADRITKTGNFLRRSRLDEIPQILNLLKGELSFVGPRPPLPEYVGLYPELYAQVLRSRPGITGLASILFHAHEERLLSYAFTPSETDDVYCRICIPRKAKLDLLYQNNRSICWDIFLMWKTVIR